MSSMTAPTTEPTITHPAWCDPELCDKDIVGGVLHDVLHLADAGTYEIGTEFRCMVQLARGDNYDGSSEGWPSALDVRSVGEVGMVSPAGLEALGAWLVERAADARQAIVTEGAAKTTVLDEDLNLTVLVEDDMVVMTGDPADGRWYFGTKEARELAAALVDHADRLESTY